MKKSLFFLLCGIPLSLFCMERVDKIARIYQDASPLERLAINYAALHAYNNASYEPLTDKQYVPILIALEILSGKGYLSVNTHKILREKYAPIIASSHVRSCYNLADDACQKAFVLAYRHAYSKEQMIPILSTDPGLDILREWNFVDSKNRLNPLVYRILRHQYSSINGARTGFYVIPQKR